MKLITPTQVDSNLVSALKNRQKHSQSQSYAEINTDKHDKAVDKESSFVSIKRQQNNLILKSSLQVSVSSGNKPLELLYRSAIDSINLILKNQLGENAIQNTYQSGLDVSPQATADRIITMSTAFLPQYKAQNPDLSDQQAMNSFIDIISGGIDSGFSEAKDILQGLDVLEGEIASNIDLTYKLVQQGLNEFVNASSNEFISK